MTATIKSGNKKIDYLILGLFVSPLEIGVYDKLKKIFLPINALIQPFRQIYYPKYIKKINSKLYREANSLIIKFSFYLSLIVILFVLFVFFMKQPLFDLLQIENSYEINFLFYCLPFTSIFLSMFWWVTNFSSSVNPNFSLFANLISTFCIISFSLFFLNLFGFIGIGLSLLTNIIILAIYWIIKYKNYAFN
jgi:O-antigen/teichoic acid export membrane protein